MAPLKNINFGDVDAKNEILKQNRAGERDFFESYSIPEKIDISEYLRGTKFFVLGLKGTGKTALLRYMHDKVENNKCISEMILFKSHITEEDRQKLSKGAGYEIISIDNVPSFIQDFKESWKWLIYQRIASKLHLAKLDDKHANKLYSLTGVKENKVTSTLGALFSRISSGNLKFSGEALGVAIELGIGIESDKTSGEVSLSSVNRACASLLNQIELTSPLYLLFDELELFFQTKDQFDRDRRIIRDLVFSISSINADSAESGRKIYLISSLRTEVLHSILELGHEIGRDVDDYGDRLDWSNGKSSPDHPLLRLIGKKIATSCGLDEDEVWPTLFPDRINNKEYFRYILDSSYYRPRDVVRLLKVARDHDRNAEKFTTAHFDETSAEYSKQTWLEITEELLASYSADEISAMQRLFLGYVTHFFKEDLLERGKARYKSDRGVTHLLETKGIGVILEDLYRIGVIGNDFMIRDRRGELMNRQRWIFRGNPILNDSERMAFHKSLWKHLTLAEGMMARR